MVPLSMTRFIDIAAFRKRVSIVPSISRMQRSRAGLNNDGICGQALTVIVSALLPEMNQVVDREGNHGYSTKDLLDVEDTPSLSRGHMNVAFLDCLREHNLLGLGVFRKGTQGHRPWEDNASGGSDDKTDLADFAAPKTAPQTPLPIRRLSIPPVNSEKSRIVYGIPPTRFFSSGLTGRQTITHRLQKCDRL